MSDPLPSPPVDPVQANEILTRFLMAYKFAIDEMMTKVTILREEFQITHDYSPIEHVSSRLKNPEGILDKARRKGCSRDVASIRANILDIAGIRITCSFLSDTYRVRDMLAGQQDVTVIEERDYIAHPKPNGYRSLHLLVSIPVFMSERVEQVPVEVQIRTIAMDFWASVEHKVYYKHDGDVPPSLLGELAEAAEVATGLDERMERLHEEVRALEHPAPPRPTWA